MASKVAALVRNFLQTDGDALYLVPGEKIFISRGTARAVAGREIVSEQSFRAVVDELIPGVAAETLASKRNRVPYVAGPGLSPVEIHFATIGGSPAMMIVRPGRGPAGGETRTPTPPPSPPEILEAPASVVAPAPAAAAPAAARVERGDVAAAAPPTAGGFEALLSLARERGASDLFVAPGRRLLLRIQGELVDAVAASPGQREIEALVAERGGARAVRALAESGSARFTAELEEGLRCLVRAARDRTGTTLAVRFLQAEAPKLESLGLPEGVSRLAGPAPGLLLVAGPPGSGRTTVLAALAARAAHGRGERVVTVEDPVEIAIPSGRGSVSQREAGTDVPSVLEGLRAAGTEDADVVLAGAVTDAASAALLVELSASGRLVLAPAPAPSLMLALQWLDSMLPEGRRVELRSLLAATFRGGVALALCRGRGGSRVAAAETLHPGSLVSELIRSGGLAAFPDHLRDSSGYVPLNTSLSGLVAAGRVEPREALLRSLDRPALFARLREQGASVPPELHAALQGGPHEP